MRFLTIEEKVIDDFRNGRIDCVYAAGYKTHCGELFDHFWNFVQTDTLPKTMRVYHVRINRQGYDSTGYYWGIGQRLYHATDGDDYSEYVRAYDRDDAIDKLGINRNQLIRL